MKISREVKNAIRSTVAFFVDYDPEACRFKVYEMDTNGESIGEIIKRGFNDSKTIISSRKDELGRIHTKKEYATAVADKCNNMIANNLLEVIQCKTCGRYFYLEEKEIQWYAENNFELPKRCKTDRRIRKNNKKDNK